MANRLAASSSTYLRQHADNPVDWWPWGDEAFDEARRRGVPVLLSVGYASCHWCHVMAHESFEDAGIAAQINEHFVPIKVDREERPDVDAIYMSATQALAGQGGWPMTVILTPEGEPFYAGTYFPPTARSGLPGFGQVLTAIAEAWAKDPNLVRTAAGKVVDAVRSNAGDLPEVPISAAQLDQVCDALVAQIDRANGGFGRAPKFPPSMTMEFLLRHYERTGSDPALDAVTLTLEKMARGGIYDQLAGGFARYSVDGTWHVPHFEKMLDDNALLLRVYAHHARITGSSLSARIAGETGDFLLRELRTDGGTFAASLDADAGGVEGRTYRWPIAELVAVAATSGAGGDAATGARGDGSATGGDGSATGGTAGDGTAAGDDGADRSVGGGAVRNALALFGVDPDHPDPEGEVLRLPHDPPDREEFTRLRARLMRVRAQRPQPGRDDIAVLRSNGLAIAALAEAGAALDRPAWVEAAGAAADALARVHRTGDGWLRSSLHEEPGPGRATLADLGGFAGGLLALYQATGDAARLTLAVQILDEMLRDFRGADGSWYDTTDPASHADRAASAGPVIARLRDPTDGAAPSGLSSAADALLTASALTGSADFRQAAEAAIASVGSLILRFPRSTGWHLSVAEAVASGPLQVAVAGPAGRDRDALAGTARRYAPGGSVIEVGDPDVPDRPLLADRPGVDGRAAAYVCRGFVCDRPVTEAGDVQAALPVGRAR